MMVPISTLDHNTRNSLQNLINRYATARKYLRFRGNAWQTVHEEVTVELVDAHFRGEETIGLFPAVDGSAKAGVIDIDLHIDGRDPTPDEIFQNESYAIRKSQELNTKGIDHVLIRHNDRGSYHILFFVEPMDALKLGSWLKEFVADKGVITVDTFPSASGKGGNGVRLPGRHHKVPKQFSMVWGLNGWYPFSVVFQRLLEVKTNSHELFTLPPSSVDLNSVADDFNERADWWQHVLLPQKFIQLESCGAATYYRRPGKNSGNSVSVGIVKDSKGRPALYNFSSSIPGLEKDKQYDKFQVFTALFFGGDAAEASRMLAKSGFGAKTHSCHLIQLNHDEPWPEPTPLDQAITPPPFPVDVLPGGIREWAEAISFELQVPLDVPALLSLAVISGGIARKVIIKARPGFVEPLNIYTIIAMEPGERKTQTFKRALSPVRDHQMRLNAMERPSIANAESRRRRLEKRLDNIEKKLGGSGGGADMGYLNEEAAQLTTQIAGLKVPILSLLYSDDDTPAALQKFIVEQGGRFMVAAAEGTSLVNICKWSDNPDFDVYLKGHGGDDLRVGRVGRPRTDVTDPALTIALAVQPEVVRNLGGVEGLRGRGFLARWLYSFPVGMVGKRMCGAPAAPKAKVDEYSRIVTAAWSIDYADTQIQTPHILTFSPSAAALFLGFEKLIEPMLISGGTLSGMAGWGNKIVGMTLRLTACLHVAESLSLNLDWRRAIDEDCLLRAVKLVEEYVIPHAKYAFAMLGSNPITATAQSVWDKLKTTRVREFTKSELKRMCRPHLDDVKFMEEVLKVLIHHDLIRAKPSVERPGPGRKPSLTFQINPRALD